MKRLAAALLVSAILSRAALIYLPENMAYAAVLSLTIAMIALIVYGLTRKAKHTGES